MWNFPVSWEPLRWDDMFVFPITMFKYFEKWVIEYVGTIEYVAD